MIAACVQVVEAPSPWAEEFGSSSRPQQQQQPGQATDWATEFGSSGQQQQQPGAANESECGPAWAAEFANGGMPAEASAWAEANAGTWADEYLGEGAGR